MQQTHLWHDHQPLARKSDPASSHAAARRVAVRAGTQAGRILACLQREGVAMTAEQISERVGLTSYTVRKRMKNPLEKGDHVIAINRDTKTSGVLRWLAVRGV